MLCKNITSCVFKCNIKMQHFEKKKPQKQKKNLYFRAGVVQNLQKVVKIKCLSPCLSHSRSLLTQQPVIQFTALWRV